MNDKSPDQAPEGDAHLDELRAADPARDVTPDVTRLEASVRARMTTHMATTQRGDSADELSSARVRRYPTWQGWVAAAAVAAVIVGGGGFALGRSSDQAPEPAGDVISAGGQVAGPEIQHGNSARQDESTSPASDRSFSGVFGGRTLFTSSGFSSTGGSAQAWAFAATKAFTKATAAKIASAVGLKGTPELVDGAWVLGPQDGSGPTLRLEPDGVTSFNFYDPTKDPSMCAKAAESRELGASSTEPGPATDLPMPGPGCERTSTQTSPAPSGDDAVRKTKELLKALGLDADAFEYEPVGGDENALMTSVTTHAVVDGQRSGVMWHVSWVAEGIQSMNGSLAPVTSLGSYELISEKDAVARLADPRFGAGGGYSSMAEDTRGGTTVQGGGSVSDPGAQIAPAPARTAPPALQPGSAIAWPVERVTLTKARLGIGLHVQPNGASLLLPTYLLSSSDSRSWSVVALADEHLDFAAPN